MQVVVVSATPLWFTGGAPVRAASAIARLGDGWLVAQDDATDGCWLPADSATIGTRLRLLPPVEGHDTFGDSGGTKHLKPDLEAACGIDGRVLLLGSGSTPARMRSVLVEAGDSPPVVADLTALYATVGRALEIAAEQLNLEGGCVVGDRFRWFQRGLPVAGIPTASVDLDLDGLLRAARGRGDPDAVAVHVVRRYDLGTVAGVGFGVTDAVAIGGGRVLASAAAEDAASTFDDGPVVGSALAVLDGVEVVAMVAVPEVDGRVVKVEGLAVRDAPGRVLDVLATVDADDPDVPSSLLRLEVTAGPQRAE